MPILDPKYIANWYYLVPTLDPGGSPRLLQSWVEKQEQTLEPQPLIQGDIGTHVMNVKGMKWVNTIDSPVVIIDYVSQGDIITSIFDAIVADYNAQRGPTFSSELTYLMQRAEIVINSENGVTCSTSYVSSEKGIFTAYFGPTPFDFIGRTAQWYDTTFFVEDVDSAIGDPNGYRVLNGKINVDFQIKENYFQGTGQTPTFSVQGYTVTGEIEIVLSPEYWDNLIITEQVCGNFTYSLSDSYLRIGGCVESSTPGIMLELGSARLHGSVERKMISGQPTTVRITFHSYARYSE
jgi:hypothetical protein